MTEILIGFGIWFACGCMFIGFGIHALRSKEAMGVIFILLGIPLLIPEATVWILLPVVGVMVELIAMMVIYVTVIEKK